MPTCLNCAQSLAGDAAFCPTCGAPVPPASRRRRKAPILAAVVGVVGVVALGVVGFRLFSSTSSAFVGGASSPEAAIEELAAALAAEDVFAAVGYIAPDEIDGASDVLDSFIATIDDGSGGIGDGTDYTVDLAPTGVNASMQGDDAAIVSFEMSGSIGSGETDGPAGVALPSSASFTASDLEELFPGGGDEVELVTVRLGGNWYVSPMLSLGNLIAEQGDLPSGDFDRVGEERQGGAKDPEAAVEAMFSAIEDRNVDDLAESLGGGEGRFATVFTDAIDELLGEIPSDVTYSVDVRTSPADGEAVTVDDVEVAYSDSYGFGSVEVKGDCIATQDEYGESDRVCVLDELPLTADVDDTIEMQTVEEDGGTRVRLVPTITDIAARLVPAIDRQTFMYAAGLQWADAATPVAVGTDVDVDFGGSLYKVFEFPAQAGTRYRVSAKGDVDIYVQRDDGTWEFVTDSSGYDDNWGGSSIDVEEDSMVRVVVESEVDDCEGFCLPGGEGTDVVRVRQVPVQTGEFPAVLSGELAPGDEIVFDLNVASAENAQIDFSASEALEWGFDDFYPQSVGDSSYALEAGPLRIYVRNNGSTVEPFELSPSEMSVGFGGSSTAVVSLDSGPVPTEVVLQPGTWVIRAVPLDGQDIVLEVAQLDCYNDAGVQGDVEECYIEVSDSFTATVVVSGWNSPENDYGLVEVSVS